MLHTPKLLGMTLEDNQKWDTYIHGKGCLISSLNSRLFQVKRLKNHQNSDSLNKVVDGLFISKIRCGLQLLEKVRLNKSDPSSIDLTSLQKIQNKLLRFLNGIKLSAKTETVLSWWCLPVLNYIVLYSIAL